MITIHHSPGTRGFRLIWLCEELAVPYTLRKVDFSSEYRASDEWRAMNPVGKVPVLEDGDTRMFESGAMVLYVLDRHGGGRLQPARSEAAYASFLQWCWFAEATFGRATGEMANHKRAFKGALKDDALAEMAGRARSCLQAVEQALDGRAWLCGDAFTAADIMMGYTLQSFDRHVGDPHPRNVESWWQRLQARDGYRAAVAAEKGMG